MLRRVEGVNIPNLSRYLEIHFPGISAAFSESLITCTFSVGQAQKCSTVYVDTQLSSTAQDTAATSGPGRDDYRCSETLSQTLNNISTRLDSRKKLIKTERTG